LIGQQLDLQLISKVPKAVAIDGLPSSGYYVLTSENIVYHFNVTGSTLQMTGKFALQPTGDGLDLAFVRADQDSVIVTQWSEKSEGVIYRYSPDGKVISVWKSRHIPGGIHFDPSSNLAYFATLDSNQVYKLDLKANEPQLFCAVRGATRLGPIDLDPDRQIIYITDLQGGLFAIDLASKKSIQLKSSFGLASALLFHRGSRVLFLADRLQKKIYAIDIETQSIRVVAESAQMTTPSGLAPGPENTLLISDEKPGAIFIAQINAPSPVKALPKARPKSKARPPLP
jgi:hypothetical protein